MHAALFSKASSLLLLLTVLHAVFIQPCSALTVEGLTLKLTLPDKVIMSEDEKLQARGSDFFRWKFPAAEGAGGSVGMVPLEKISSQAQLLPAAQALLAKKQAANADPDRRLSPLMPLTFRNRGWTGFIFQSQALVNGRPSSKYAEYTLVLWGGEQAWQCYLDGNKLSLAKLMQVLESTVFKKP